jgi:hypothetical protein
VFLPCAVPLFRYSRVLWLYIDWQLDPVEEAPPAPLPPIMARAWLIPTPQRPWTHDSLFALTQRLATLIDPIFDRSLPRREVEALAGRERAAWGTDRFGLLGERDRPQPGETFRRHAAFSAYGLARDQQLVVAQEIDRAETAPRVIIQASATVAVLDQIDRLLVTTYGAVPVSAHESTTS